MPLVTVNNLTIRFRGPALLDGVDCLIEPGQRIGLMGRNGAGKSTFLRLLAGVIEPDHGNVQFSGNVALLQQDVPVDLHGRIDAVVRLGVKKVAHSPNMAGDAELAWEIDHKVEQILSRMELSPAALVENMSSGMKRRVLLAQALVDQPDLLLLDEPTNHLDIEAIRWLEDFLARWEGAYVFITHDRQFLRKLATRILEIEGGRLFDWTCDYDTFLARKQDAIAAEEKQNALFDKKLAAEEVWIRQGIKARRTRNEGRVRALKELRLVRSERRAKVGTSNLQIQQGSRSGNLVVQVEDVSFARQSANGVLNPILEDFSTTIMRGDKVGIIGRNGAGKTTLLKVLLGELAPQAGTVRLGTNLQIAYFDQLRAKLDEEKTVEEDVGDGYQSISIDGKSKHILGYLQDFLFTPERARTLIKRLSGGERNRVLLAKLFAKPANVIVLDEPTNDLDAETLEMLEERLVEYQGTLLVVSHDREFLNNVVSSCIVFESDDAGLRVVREYVGGYDDWQRQRLQNLSARPSPTGASSLTAPYFSTKVAESKKQKLNFKEIKELSELPGRIEQLESQIAGKHEAMLDPEFYKQSREKIAFFQSELKQLDEQKNQCFARWEELESRQA